MRLVFAEYAETPNLIEETPWVRSEAFLELNPAGTLPVLVDDNEAVISGAAIIFEYLAETRGTRHGEQQSLQPADPAVVNAIAKGRPDRRPAADVGDHQPRPGLPAKPDEAGAFLKTRGERLFHPDHLRRRPAEDTLDERIGWVFRMLRGEPRN